MNDPKEDTEPKITPEPSPEPLEAGEGAPLDERAVRALHALV